MRAKSIRNLIIIMLAVFSRETASGQDAARIYIEPTGWSIGTHFGLTDLWGDVGTKSFLDHYTNSKYFDKVCFMGGMNGRYTFHPSLSVKMMLSYGVLFANDQWNKDKADLASSQGEDSYQRYARNQKAKTNVVEAAGVLEFTPFRRNPEKPMANRMGQLYVGAGLGYFHFQPQSTVALGEKFVKIYNLHLEGDGFGDGYPESYSLWQFCVPMSIGYRWDIGQHLNLGFEFNYRMTFNDYLDGVSGKYIDPKEYAKHLSPSEAAKAYAIADKSYLERKSQAAVAGDMRGNPDNNDAFSTINVVFYYKVFTRTKQWWKTF